MLFVRSLALLLGGFALLSAPLYARAQQRSQTPAERQSAPPRPASPAPGTQAQQPSPGREAGQQEQRPWRVQVSNGFPLTISLRAREASLAEIATELSRRLQATLQLSPLMQRQRITLQFSDLPLETAMRLLAPQVYIDYEIRSDASAQPKALGIYLYAASEEPPPLNAVVRNNSQAVLIEGHTEDGTDNAPPEQERPLRVDYVNGRLSVRARQQPLTAVLYEIASQIGIPFELRGDSSALITIELNNAGLEEVISQLSPHIRLYARANLQTAQNQPLRLVLFPAARP